MYLGIYTVVCCAILAGFATTAEKPSPRNSDLTFPEGDGAIEGSGSDAEVTHDLESSGSGFGGIGPDDEDTVIAVNSNNLNTEKKKKEPKKTDVYSKSDEILTDSIDSNDNNNDNGVLNQPQPTPVIDTGVKMNPRPEDKERFFAQPGILAAVIGGAVVGLLCAILVVMFIVYRMRKKDEGSYALGEPKQSPTANSYSRGNNKEFYA